MLKTAVLCFIFFISKGLCKNELLEAIVRGLPLKPVGNSSLPDLLISCNRVLPVGVWMVPEPPSALCTIDFADLIPYSQANYNSTLCRQSLQKRIIPAVAFAIGEVIAYAGAAATAATIATAATSAAVAVYNIVEPLTACQGTVSKFVSLKDHQSSRYLSHDSNPVLGGFTGWKVWNYPHSWNKFTILPDDELCLDGSSNGRRVYLHKCNGDNAHQFWKPREISTNVFLVEHKQSGLCLDSIAGTNKVRLHECSRNHAGELWGFW
jgi:hypothetical protein